MGIDSTLNNYDSSLDLDFALDDLQDLPDDTQISIPTTTTLNHHLTDYSALCIPTDSIEDIGWLLPSFSTSNSFPFKTESLSFPGTPRSCLDVPTTPEQDIEFNWKKRDLQEVVQEEEHVFVNKKQRSKRIGRVWSSNVNALLPPKKRSCRHCGTEKTPQWREGPMGPKTLCNACGVRYKSGRLVPEYRPAASPTFNSQMHSNSHKKIVKMRMMTPDF